MKEKKKPNRKPNRKPNTECDLCKKPIYRRPSTLQKNNGKFCSKSCSNSFYREHFMETSKGKNPKKALKGEDNPAWKGGVTYSHKRDKIYEGKNKINKDEI